MTRQWKLAAAGIAAAAVLGWGLTRREASSGPDQKLVPAAAPAQPAVSLTLPPAAVEASAKAAKKAALPARTAKPRGSGLLEKGEALGGTAP